jgi:hypothetical protein
MSGFTSQLHIRAWPAAELRAAGAKRQQYDLLAPLTFRSAIHGEITAPAGVTSDGASIPRFAWQYIDPEDPCILYPAIIHDALYAAGGGLAPDRALSRKQCDEVLVEAMRHCGARWDQCQAVFGAVRIGGSSRWRSR